MDQIIDLKDSLMNNEFNSINDIRQRVEHAFEKLGPVEEIRHNIGVYLSDLKIKNMKSSEKSRSYRQKGNEYFEHKNLEYALYYYCLAILSAPYPTESVAKEENELSYAFTARSLTQAEMKAYENALFDINCALTVTGFSMRFDQRLQLMAHKVNCLCHLKRYETAFVVVSAIIELIPCLPIYNDLVKSFIQVKDQIFEELYNSKTDEVVVNKSNAELIEEQLKNAQDYISRDLKLSVSVDRGRHYVANKDIPKGEIIVVEKSMVGTIFKDFYRSHCHNCLRNLGYKWWPCRQCRNVVFCDQECAKNDEFHAYECGIIDAIQSLGPSHHIVFRLILLIGPQEVTALRKRNVSEDKTIDEKEAIKLKYQKFVDLVDHRDKYDLNSKVMSICKSIQMAFLLDYFEQFGSKDDLKDIVTLLDENNYKVVVNVFGINESFDDCRPFRGIHIGNAIALNSSFFNHSCSPNTFWVFNARYITIVTKKDIKCGDELTISYGPQSSDNSKEERQSLLEKRYFFQCKCSECLKEFTTLPMDE